MPEHFQCGSYLLSLQHPLVMGIVNVTPDSFSDGGHFLTAQHAIDHGLRLIDEGADILDIGGESTRPGAPVVSPEEELARIAPVLDALVKRGIPVSVDTSKTRVMKHAIAAGASMINDVNALQARDALKIAANSNVGVCVMHRQGNAQTMQHNPQYNDVVAEVADFLRAQVDALERAGAARNRISVDPGFGFGKNLEHNLALLAELSRFRALNVPLLIGVSRKGFLGLVSGRKVDERSYASVAAALIAAQQGAAILRVHDVGATRDALAVLSACNSQFQGNKTA